jgi:NADP-reducing hydrogenase subunit HndB
MSKKITSPQDLIKLRDQAKGGIELRTGAKPVQITIHMGTCGIAAGARDVLAAFADELMKAKREDVTLRQAGCIGLCDREPMCTFVDAAGSEFRYGKLDQKKARTVVQEHVLGGNPVVSFLITKK